MADKISNKEAHDLYNVRNVQGSIYNHAKQFWVVGLAFKIAAVICGVALTFLQISDLTLPFLLALAGLASEGSQWRSDTLKGQAESLTRKIEFSEGLGWKIAGTDYATILNQIPESRRQAIEKAAKENYFASDSPTGARRMVQNVHESAFWSKHLSQEMGNISACAAGLLMLAAFATLGFSMVRFTELAFVKISIEQAQHTSNAIVKFTMALISLGLSLGLVKMIVGYHSFARKSDDAVTKALNVLKSPQVTNEDALKILHEYQIARVSSPLIPSWLWRKRRDRLNQDYDNFCKNDPAVCGVGDGK